MLDPGDVVITENPTFLGGLIAFNPYEPAYAPVRSDDGGMDVDDLERVLERTPRARLLYTMPDFQNPTGVTLALDRRRRLVELANRFNVLVVEDTPYRDLRFEGEALPSLKSFDTEGRVVYLGSFSKTLAPGMRLGWAVASGEIIAKLGLLKLAADTQCSTLNMAAASAYLDRFDLDEHIGRIRSAYRRKRDLMLGVIAESFPSSIAWTRPDGGLFTWLTFPDGFDTTAFMRDELLPEGEGRVRPGRHVLPGDPGAEPRAGQLLGRVRRADRDRDDPHGGPAAGHARILAGPVAQVLSPGRPRAASLTSGGYLQRGTTICRWTASPSW